MTNYLAQKNALPLRLNAVNINYSTIIGSSIVFTSSIRGSTINNDIIVTQFINYSTITGSTINAGSLTANGLSFSTLTGSTLNTSTITMTNATGLGSTFAITNGTSAVTHTATPQYQLDISETTRATTVEYSDGSDTVTAAPPLDYSQFGQIWTPVNQLPRATWTAVAISASGQYQTVGSNGSGIYYSSNYGQTWTFASMSGYIVDLKISASGQYQIAAILGGGINYSSNYGQTWTASNAPNLNWRSVCISASGQYGSAGAITLGNANTFSYVTSNYGQTWTASSFTGFNFAMACSASGQYQVSGQGNNGGIPGIFFSSNYGRNFTISNNTTSQAAWFAAMSATGQYVVVSTNPVSNVSMFVSNNYGRTFINITLGFMSYGATMSASGQYQMVTAYSSGNGYGTGIYYSANYGQTWTLSPSTASLGGMLQVATSANGQYSLACPVAAGSVYQSITPFANTMASTNLLTQTLQPTALTFSDGSALTSASDPLDYSTFAINWTQSGSISTTWFACAMSANGQYQIAAQSSGWSANSGTIYYSSNYGQTWTAVTNSPSNSWSSVSMSASGQYAVICVGNSSIEVPGPVYISSTYGQTWSITTLSVCGNTAISASGQYMAVANQSNGVSGSSANGTYVSSNYGQSWTRTYTAQKTYRVTMSATGQYQFTTSFVPLGNHYSYDYGQTWTSMTALTAFNANIQAITCSASGQYVSATNGGTFYYSSNYGQTWASGTSGSSFNGIAMSASGQYQVAGGWGNNLIYYSRNYGQSWTSQSVPGNITTVAISANGQYITGTSGFNHAINGAGFIYTSITRFPPLLLNNIPQPNALSSATNPGYTTLPGGIIMQFGNGSFTPTIANGVPGTQFFVYFPKPFTTACYGVQVSLGDLGAGTNYMQMFPSASFTNTYFAFAVKGLYPTTFTFTTSGGTGRTGPTSLSYSYLWATPNSFIEIGNGTNAPAGMQRWVVPFTGTYTFTAAGAGGGSGFYAGGRGAVVSTTYSLNAGEIVFILVGQKGFYTAGSAGYQGSGGGGTFICKYNGGSFTTAGSYTIILIAGGGGGAGALSGGGDAVSTTTGGVNTATTFRPTAATGGAGGNRYSNGGNFAGTGGGGFSGNGLGGTFVGGSSQNAAALSFINGGTGGADEWTTCPGGFGGGAASNATNANWGVGGGGGYSGGGGATVNQSVWVWTNHGAGGGGSYDINGPSNNATLSLYNGADTDGFVTVTRPYNFTPIPIPYYYIAYGK